jgi:D-alanyl-D-alanine carboxypeptidase (penicillin-binding protein 5/6)
MPVKAFVPRLSGDKLTAKIVYQGPVAAPVEADQPFGELQLFQNETLVLRSPLKTKTAVPVGSLTQRAADAALELGKDWLRRAWRRP